MLLSFILIISAINIFAVFSFAISSFGNGILYHVGWQLCSRYSDICDGTVSTAVEHVTYAAILLFPMQIMNLRQYIDWKLAFNLCMTQQIGLFSGMYVIYSFHSIWIGRGLGILMLTITFYKINEELKVLNVENGLVSMKYAFDSPKDYHFVWMIGITSGLFGGMYATGGPPLMYFVSASALDRNVCRGTVAFLYLIENIGRLFYIFVVARHNRVESDNHDSKVMYLSILCLTITSLMGLFLGNIIFQYINQKHFRYIIILLLTFGSVLLTTTGFNIIYSLIVFVCILGASALMLMMRECTCFCLMPCGIKHASTVEYGRVQVQVQVHTELELVSLEDSNTSCAVAIEDVI